MLLVYMFDRIGRIGGVTPFGHKTVSSGRFNKNGKEVADLVIDPEEASLVRLIFEKTVCEDYGSHRLASILNEMNVKTHNGSDFQSNTVNRILKNRMYCGFYVSGDITSPHLPHLQIIDEQTFDHVQRILEQRAGRNEQKTQNAHNTKKKTLFSGNIYCAHCGSHLTTTSYMDSRTRTDGSKYGVQRQRYICQTKSQRRGVCDGQSGYSSDRIDDAVNTIVLEYLSRIKTEAKLIILEKRYQDEIAEMKVKRRKTEQDQKRLKEQLSQLAGEIAKTLTGESKYAPDTLSKKIENAQTELQNTEDALVKLNCANSQSVLKNLDFYYDQVCGWADEFEEASFEERKMIICQLVREINVSRGYELDIVLDMNYEHFLSA